MEYKDKNLRCSKCLIQAGLEETFSIAPPDNTPFAVTVYKGEALCWYCLKEASKVLKKHFDNSKD